MKIKARGCETCPQRWDDLFGDPKRDPACQISSMRAIIGQYGLDEYPNWCPLLKEPVTVEKA